MSSAVNVAEKLSVISEARVSTAVFSSSGDEREEFLVDEHETKNNKAISKAAFRYLLTPPL